jgi:BNR repeat-like domain
MWSEAVHRARGSGWLGAVGMAAAFAVATALPAYANESSGARVLQVSTDPFTNATSQHRTEVEPDTFASGDTWVSGFQVGRIFDGGASDIGFAASLDGGERTVHGVLPGITLFTTPAGPYDRASDASVAFDQRHHVWLISYLGIHNLPNGSTGAVDVLVSRSFDGVHWGLPVIVSAQNTFFDKNWTVCDNSRTSPHFGNCYTEFDAVAQRDLEQMSTSTDGGRTWAAAQATADAAHGLGGQPLVQPNGRVVVPFEGVNPTRGMRAFTSNDGGATWTASVVITPITAHRVAGDIRTSPLPTAEVDREGRVFVAWQDCRFEAGCTANDVVLSTSDDGVTWSPISRIPIDPIGSGVDHFIPGLGVDRSSSDSRTRLALTYYFYPAAGCDVTTCQLQVAFVSSTNSGATWSRPEVLTRPMNLAWIADTSQGVMVADYVSTSFVDGAEHARSAFAIAAPPVSGSFRQAIFSARTEVRGGSVPLTADPVVFGPGAAGGVGDADDTGDDGAPLAVAPTSF